MTTPAPTASPREAFRLGRELERAILEMEIAGDTEDDSDSPLASRVRELNDRAVLALAPVGAAQPASSSAPTVEQAINALVDALRDSKGWMRGYADAIIRDAIDRSSSAPAVGGVADLDALMTMTFGKETVPQVWFKRADVERIVATALAAPAGAAGQDAPRLVGSELLGRAAHMYECYADWIKRNVMSANIEEHPYLPELEGVAEDLRAALAAQGDGGTTA